MATSSTTIQELEAEKKKLLQSLYLPDIMESGTASQLLRTADTQYIADLLDRVDMPWGEEGLCPELTQFFISISKQSDEARRLSLDSELEFLKKVSDSGEDVIHRGPFHTLEAAFPVRLRGKVVHCVWSGRVKEKPFTDEDVAELVKLTGKSEADVQKLVSDIPIVSEALCDQLLDACRKIRDALKQSISQHLQARELNDQLLQSERTQSLGTLSGGVAHHFNNLLSVILGYASHVHNREDLSDDADNALLKITEAAQRGRRLTEEILAFAGSDSEEDAPCKVHETVNSVLSLLQSQTSSRVRIVTDLKADHDTVVAPPGSIRQVIFNLLNNAIDSTPAGHELGVVSSNTVMDSGSGKQTYLKLEVTDASGHVPAGFAADYPASASATDTLAGERSSGLKFNSLYGMVGRLDGTITVNTEPGQHTRVEVLLPVEEEGAPTQSDEKVKMKLAASEIWVVDDDPIFREMCHQVLSDEGHTVEEMAGGRQLQDLWKSGQKRPQLIIIDFSMPEYNGLELCEWLRDEGSRVPVVLVSGFSPNQRDIRKALQLRKTYFLQKPFTFRELADTVTVALGETLIGE